MHEAGRYIRLVLLIAASGACLDERIAELPDGIDYWTLVYPERTMASARRLIRADSGRVVALDGPGWIVGYSAETLLETGLPSSAVDGLDVFVAGPCDERLPPPDHVVGIDLDGDPPFLAAAQLPARVACDGPRDLADFDPTDFVRTGYEIAGSESWEDVVVGLADTGGFVLVARARSDGRLRLFEVDDQSAALVGVVGLPTVSDVARVDGTYYFIDGGQVDVFAAEDSEQPAVVEGPRPGARPGRLHVTAGRRLLVIDASGALLWTVHENPRVVDTGVFQGRYGDPIQVMDDPVGGVVAGSQWFGWRFDGFRIEDDLAIRSPFARIGGKLVVAFGAELRALAEAEARPMAPFADLSDGLTVVSVDVMNPFARGAIVADTAGRVLFVDEHGSYGRLDRIEGRAVRMRTHGRRIAAIVLRSTLGASASVQVVTWTWRPEQLP